MIKEQNGRGRVQKEVVPTGTSVPEGVKTTVVLQAKRGRTQDSERERYCLLLKCNWLRLVPHLGLYKSRGAPS